MLEINELLLLNTITINNTNNKNINKINKKKQNLKNKYIQYCTGH